VVGREDVAEQRRLAGACMDEHQPPRCRLPRVADPPRKPESSVTGSLPTREPLLAGGEGAGRMSTEGAIANVKMGEGEAACDRKARRAQRKIRPGHGPDSRSALSRRS